MSVFSTTGEAPIDEREIMGSFDQMDQNKDNVISKEEFFESEGLSFKLFGKTIFLFLSTIRDFIHSGSQGNRSEAKIGSKQGF